MAGAERAGEPHGRRRSAGRTRGGVADNRSPLNAEGRVSAPAPTADARATGGDDSAQGHPATRPPARSGDASEQGHLGTRHAIAPYIRAYPQVFVLVLICLVLGLGTFLAVVFGLLTAGSGQTTGEPSGAILGTHVLAPATRWLLL